VLKEKIKKEAENALRSKDELSLSVHRLLMTAISRVEHSAEHREVSDDEIIKIIMSETKKRKEAAKLYRQGNREEQAQKEENEAKILEQYLPPAPTEEEIKKIISETETDNPGLIIKEVMQRTGGRADIDVIRKFL
jgi:uncharacterized protein